MEGAHARGSSQVYSPAVVTQPPTACKRSRVDSTFDHGLYQKTCPTISGPHASVEFRSVTIPFGEMDILAAAVYRQLIDLIYDANDPPKGSITEAQFLGVVAAIFKSRLDHVASKVSLVRSASHLPLATSIALPRILADAINTYGSHYVNNKTTLYYPISADASHGDNLPNHVSSFSALIQTAKLRSFICTSFVVPTIEGTGSWMLRLSASVGSRSNPGAHADADSAQIYVRAQFQEFTPGDAIIAALVCNQRDCVTLIGCTEFPFSVPEISNVPMLRYQLATSM